MIRKGFVAKGGVHWQNQLVASSRNPKPNPGSSSPHDLVPVSSHSKTRKNSPGFGEAMHL